jgi:hypothetical protein
MKKKEQDALYNELTNGCRHRSARYNLQIGNDIGNGYCFYLCRNSFLNVLGIGNKRYKTLKETRFTPGANLHKNTGNQHSALSAEVTSSTVNFILQKGVEEARFTPHTSFDLLQGMSFNTKRRGRSIFLQAPLVERCTSSIASLAVGLLSQTKWEVIPSCVTIQGGRRMTYFGRMMLRRLMYVLGFPFGRYERNIVLI